MCVCVCGGGGGIRYHLATKFISFQSVCEMVSRILFFAVIFVFEMAMCKARMFFPLSVGMDEAV